MMENMKNKPLQIAIIGAGFSGLALAHSLLSHSSALCEVSIFHKDPITQSASAVAAGLLHPFPSAKKKRSLEGLQALHAAVTLLDAAQKFSPEKLFIKKPILKLALNDEEKRQWSHLARKYDNLRFITPEKVSEKIQTKGLFYALEIDQGYQVYCQKYLQALHALCQHLGAKFIQKEVDFEDDFSMFDHVIFCHGYGFRKSKNLSTFGFVKGQILTCKVPSALTSAPLIANGYICPSDNPLIYLFGSTYEHRFSNEMPNRSLAFEKIIPPWQKIFPDLKNIEVLDCQAGVRVMHVPKYLPLIKKIKTNQFLFTALGSKGLLYHSYLAKALADYLITKQMPRISHEFFSLH